eukprot:TRINITY_DN1258_c0_g1_i1.p1 TRINITY_DN1258_c0_g1~~TRINITY_DN1258_c0_g1_i1.p1  ORF type:complete len:357 (+),score=92.87 TRINITY_DN1258_c0_g1_i1:34-1071(+)
MEWPWTLETSPFAVTVPPPLFTDLADELPALDFNNDSTAAAEPCQIPAGPEAVPLVQWAWTNAEGLEPAALEECEAVQPWLWSGRTGRTSRPAAWADPSASASASASWLSGSSSDTDCGCTPAIVEMAEPSDLGQHADLELLAYAPEEAELQRGGSGGCGFTAPEWAELQAFLVPLLETHGHSHGRPEQSSSSAAEGGFEAALEQVALPGKAKKNINARLVFRLAQAVLAEDAEVRSVFAAFVHGGVYKLKKTRRAAGGDSDAQRLHVVVANVVRDVCGLSPDKYGAQLRPRLAKSTIVTLLRQLRRAGAEPLGAQYCELVRYARGRLLAALAGNPISVRESLGE